MSSIKRDLDEKRRMEEAVAKVREVVRTASKNDIVLALHIYDLDVDRTIQAFCDDGAQNALGSWESSGAAKKKNRRKKKESLSAEEPKTDVIPAAASSKQVTGPPRRAETGNPRLLKGASGSKTGNSKSASSVVGQISSSPALVIEPPRNVNVYKAGDSEEEACSFGISSLKNFGEEIKAAEASFEKELSLAEENARNVFKSIRQLLNDRESHLLAELKRTHDDGIRIFSERRVKANGLLDRSKRIKAMSDREKKGFCEELAVFSAERLDEADLAHAARFVCDNKLIMKIIKNFGEVASVKTTGGIAPSVISPLPSGDAPPAVAETKNSISRSSRASSVGEDSGLGQISPTGEDHKHMAEVSDGGILMKSDALTADQLADLNAKVRETLKAQGIDADLFSGLTIPARRRTGGGARNKPRAGKQPPPLPDPQLSIFE